MTPLAAHIPVLETERLRLRAPVKADFDAYAEILMSDRARYMGGPHSRNQARAGFDADVASWLLDGFGYWTAEDATGTPIAFLGIMHPEHFPEVELGWFTTEAAEGKGYAYEAANAALDWAFGPGERDTLVSYIDPENTRSIALAEKLGAKRDADATAPDPTDLVYRHPKRGASGAEPTPNGGRP
ncbi:MAG: GNAT family N-acetyltransferase [Silicimonas sp.]|nr:GNAT family N-acetyltransferase [Silicimonas sp.]